MLAFLGIVMGIDSDHLVGIVLVPDGNNVALLEFRLWRIGRAEQVLIALVWDALPMNAIEAGVKILVRMRVELDAPHIVVGVADEDAVERLELMLHLF